MPPPNANVELTVRYPPAENGWLTASIPSVRGATSIGRARVEARENVVDALGEMLATVPDEQTLDRTQIERVHPELSLLRRVEPSWSEDLLPALSPIAR
jgi:hypothetical protein